MLSLDPELHIYYIPYICYILLHTLSLLLDMVTFVKRTLIPLFHLPEITCRLLHNQPQGLMVCDTTSYVQTSIFFAGNIHIAYKFN